VNFPTLQYRHTGVSCVNFPTLQYRHTGVSCVNFPTLQYRHTSSNHYTTGHVSSVFLHDNVDTQLTEELTTVWLYAKYKKEKKNNLTHFKAV